MHCKREGVLQRELAPARWFSINNKCVRLPLNSNVDDASHHAECHPYFQRQEIKVSHDPDGSVAYVSFHQIILEVHHSSVLL